MDFPTYVLGLDLSLTGTGMARATSEGIETSTIKTPADKIRGHARLKRIVDEITGQAMGAELAVVEGPSFGSKGNALHQLGGLWWMVTNRLWAIGLPYVIASPSSVKKYLTGKGNGVDKVAMALEFGKRFPGVEAKNDNEIDAAVLAAIGKRYLGHAIDSVPKAHLTVMDALGVCDE